MEQCCEIGILCSSAFRAGFSVFPFLIHSVNCCFCLLCFSSKEEFLHLCRNSCCAQFSARYWQCSALCRHHRRLVVCILQSDRAIEPSNDFWVETNTFPFSSKISFFSTDSEVTEEQLFCHPRGALRSGPMHSALRPFLPLFHNREQADSLISSPCLCHSLIFVKVSGRNSRCLVPVALSTALFKQAEPNSESKISPFISHVRRMFFGAWSNSSAGLLLSCSSSCHGKYSNFSSSSWEHVRSFLWASQASSSSFPS